MWRWRHDRPGDIPGADREAQETLDALTYGIRSIGCCRSAWGASPAHCAQIAAACEAAGGILGRVVALDNGTLGLLKAAKKLAAGQLAAAKDQVKALGSKRQLRLALAAPVVDESVCFGCGKAIPGGPGNYYCDECVAGQMVAATREREAFDAFHRFADDVARRSK